MKRRYLLLGIVAVLSICACSCGKKEVPVVEVVSSKPADEGAVSGNEASEGEEQSKEYVTNDGTVTGEELTGSGEEETTGQDSEHVIEALGAGGADTDSMLEGTRVGVSGYSIYVMVDGKGLLYDFTDYGLVGADKVDGVVTGGGGFHGDATYLFSAYFGGVANKQVGKKVETRKIGDMSCDIYWDAENLLYTVYCKELDASLQAMGGYGGDADTVYGEIEEAVKEDLKYFDATEKK